MSEDLDSLPTQELRDRAFHKARERHDVGFFWGLLKHLPAAEGLSEEDSSSGGLTSGITELFSLGHEFTNSDLGDEEPLLRARFITYLETA